MLVTKQRRLLGERRLVNEQLCLSERLLQLLFAMGSRRALIYSL